MSKLFKVLTATMVAVLSLTIVACSADKDSVVDEKSTVIEDEDKDLSEVIWSSDETQYNIMLDVEDGVVTDISLESNYGCSDAEMQMLMDAWLRLYDGLPFAGVYDGRSEGKDFVRANFYNLDNPENAKAFVDLLGGDDEALKFMSSLFELDGNGLIDQAATEERLHAAGFTSMAEDLAEIDEALAESNEALEEIAAD